MATLYIYIYIFKWTYNIKIDKIYKKCSQIKNYVVNSNLNKLASRLM